MYQNYNESFAYTNASSYTCKFSYKRNEYDQRCPKCKSKMTINSTRHRDVVENTNNKNHLYEFDKNTNTYYKNYRTACCMACNKNFEMNWKTKHYIFFGLICWKSTNLYYGN